MVRPETRAQGDRGRHVHGDGVAFLSKCGTTEGFPGVGTMARPRHLAAASGAVAELESRVHGLRFAALLYILIRSLCGTPGFVG